MPNPTHVRQKDAIHTTRWYFHSISTIVVKMSRVYWRHLLARFSLLYTCRRPHLETRRNSSTDVESIRHLPPIVSGSGKGGAASAASVSSCTALVSAVASADLPTTPNSSQIQIKSSRWEVEFQFVEKPASFDIFWVFLRREVGAAGRRGGDSIREEIR